MGIHVVVADQDEEYIRLFTQYIQASEFHKRVVIQSFSKINHFQKYLLQDTGESLILICSEWEEIFKSTVIKSTVVILTDEIQSTHSSMTCIDKYQPLDEILYKLLSMVEKKSVYKVTSRCSVISVYSTIGGAGKTTAAIQLTRQLTSMGKRVFYLNLESIGSDFLLTVENEAHTFSQLLYYLKTKPQELNDKLQRFVTYDMSLKCDVIHPLRNYKDIDEMNKQDIEVLIMRLIEVGRYDVIVMDLETSLHSRIWGAIEISDHVIYLVTDDLVCLEKTKRLWSEFLKIYESQVNRVLPKLHYTLNKYTGVLHNDFETLGIKLKSYLPYIPEWKGVNDKQQWNHSKSYNQHILSLYLSLREDQKEQENGSENVAREN